MLYRILSMAFILLMLVLAGCSSAGNNPAAPVSGEDDLLNPTSRQGNDGHYLWGLYELYVDPEALTVGALPIRGAQPHYDVTSFMIPPACNDCIIIKVLDFNPDTRIMKIDITLKNPTPITGYDVRGIILYNDAGHDLSYPDGWTSVWDDCAPPFFNPFMRYGKDDPVGKFAAFGSLKETYRLIIPDPPQYDAIRFAIDAIWPKNSKREPYEICDEYVDGYLYDDGSDSVKLWAMVLDRHYDVEAVTIECPELFSGTKHMGLVGGQWRVEFSNENGAAAQEDPYIITIEAYDSVVPYTLRDTCEVNVIERLYNWMPNLYMEPIGECSLDVTGITGGEYDGGGYMVDTESDCTVFKASEDAFSYPAPVLDLVDLNASNLTLQPYPPVRFDSVAGGGLAFTNASEGIFEDSAYSVSLNQVVITLDSDLVFKDDSMGNHQAHYPVDAGTLVAVDVCGGFTDRFYALWAETTGDHLPVIQGYEPSYATQDLMMDAVIPAEFIGSGDGQIINDAVALKGIDVLEVMTTPFMADIKLYILENDGDGAQVEVFYLSTNLSTLVTDIAHVLTIDLLADLGEACDLELLPPNAAYAPNPDAYTLAVVFEFDIGGYAAGNIRLYDPETGGLVEELGNKEQPSLFEDVHCLDVVEGMFTMVVTSKLTDTPDDSVLFFLYTYM